MIHYVKGDATEPQVTEGVRIIAHICNNLGGWGRGFVVALSNKWRAPEQKYREWFKWAALEDKDGNVTMPLGQIQLVQVPDKNGILYVCNMIAQHGYVSPDNPVAVKYDALTRCLLRLNSWAGTYLQLKSDIGDGVMGKMPDITVHMPYIGCGLAGGSWEIVSRLIEGALTGTDTYVYEFDQ